MLQKIKIILQYIVPQHGLTRLSGLLGECRWRWWKNWAIKFFIKKYHVDLSQAEMTSLEDYPNFNSFFTRKLKPGTRPIAGDSQTIVSPADGVVSQVGQIHKNMLFQAKGFYFSLDALLGGSDNLVKTFYNGSYATIYLAPKDYHRVHMPVAGELRETIYIPGKLFSVNQATTLEVPELFAKNERLVCVFETAQGPMIVILVGAMLVGAIRTVWPLEFSHKRITKKFYDNMVRLDKGAELGLFKLGSTVITLFPKNKMQWSDALRENTYLQMGKAIGSFSPMAK